MVVESGVENGPRDDLDDKSDRNERQKKFYCGVVEGFYGKPWTTGQRKELFRRMQALGMDMYLYAPKDDCKHRMYWRDLYSVEEADHLTSLIEAANEFNVTFVYALSPGLDMSYSNAKEVTCLKRKLEQVSTFGCKAFALLFDDIDVDMNEADKAIFQSFAQAQVSVTNEVYQHLGQPENFLFCPTEYCSTRAVPSVPQSEYLSTIGSRLLPNIDIMWTGPKVVSKELSVEHLMEISHALQRPPVIWDNIHANDYDQKRLYLGPFEGRPTQIIPHLRGVMTNPNCEFEANYIAIHTLAQWAKSDPDTVNVAPLLSSSPVCSDIKLEREGDLTDDLHPDGYRPKEALHKAIKDWMVEFKKECKAPSEKLSPAPIPTIAPPTSPIPAPLGLPSFSNTVVQGVDGFNSVEINESFMQPKTVTPVNSLMEPIDSGVDSSVEHLEPMDCISSITSPVLPDGEKHVATGYDSGCADCDITTIDKSEITEKMQMDMDCNVVGGKTEGLAFLIPDSTDCQSCTESMMLHAGKLCCQDVHMLVDLFYMPFEHGAKSSDLLNELLWLKLNCSSVTIAKSKSATEDQKMKGSEWSERAELFRSQLDLVLSTLNKFLEVPNKAILCDLYQYIWDMKTILTIVDAFIAWLAMGHVPAISLYYMQGNPYTWANIYYQEAFRSGAQEPWVFRGGLQAEFQRLLPLDGAADLLIPSVPSSYTVNMLKVRPYRHADEAAVYEICRRTCDDGLDATDIFPSYPDLMGDKHVGGFLTNCPEYCFVLENESNRVVGYAVACLDIAEFNKKIEMAWIPAMQEKYPKSKKENGLSPAEEVICGFHNYKNYSPADLYSRFPSIVRVDILPECKVDPTACKRVLAGTVVSLKTNGSHGIYTELQVGDQNIMDMYSSLQFHSIPLEDLPEGSLVLGRVI